MPRLTVQDGKLLLRDGKPGTEASCCCGTCCECLPTRTRLRVNGYLIRWYPVNASGPAGADLTDADVGDSLGALAGGALGYDQPACSVLSFRGSFFEDYFNAGAVFEKDNLPVAGHVGDHPIIQREDLLGPVATTLTKLDGLCAEGGQFSTAEKSAFVMGCLRCVNGQSILSLAIYVFGHAPPPPVSPSDPLYDLYYVGPLVGIYTAYYAVDTTNCVGGVMTCAPIEPPADAIIEGKAPHEGGGEVVDGVVVRLAAPENNPTLCGNLAEFFTPTLECLCPDAEFPLQFSSCMGGGAEGTAIAVNGEITEANLTKAGSGYARLGRVQPTVTASAAGGSGATLSVTLEQKTDSCLSMPYWSVASVAVTAAGSGYSDNANVTFSTSDGTAQNAASGKARIAYDEPQNATLTISTAGGSGAVLVPVWELLDSSAWPEPHKKTYRLASVTVTNGGNGYANYEEIAISFASASDGTVIEAAYVDVDIVGTGGVIEQVYVADADDIDTPAAAGQYVGRPTTGLYSVSVSQGGKYYKEDASKSPYVAPVTVTIVQEAPVLGHDAEITATVEDDTSSADFGKIVSLTVTKAGEDYVGPCYNPLP